MLISQNSLEVMCFCQWEGFLHSLALPEPVAAGERRDGELAFPLFRCESEVLIHCFKKHQAQVERTLSSCLIPST